jgi:hypothetical protein
MEHLILFAGLSWDPAIKGILVVAIAVTILMGSIYLIVATNTGARLGMLISLAGLFGWLSIMSLFWWIQPPGIGPSGKLPSWQVEEIYIHDASSPPAQLDQLNNLPDPSQVVTAREIIEANPDIAGDFVTKPENTTLSDVAALAPDDNPLLGSQLVPQPDELGGWRVISTSQAGEGQAAADAALVASGLFTDATGYKKLNAFQYGQDKDALKQECDLTNQAGLIPSDPLCRVWQRVRATFDLFHEPRYQVVQVQPVIQQTAEEGQPPPTPIIDESQPVISVVLLRDEGSLRAKPAYFFVISFSLFVIFTLMLHYRDKTLQQHLDDAKAGKGLVKRGD